MQKYYDRLIKRIAPVFDLKNRVSISETKVAKIAEIFEGRTDYRISFWYDPSYWEMTVQLPLRDLCRPGDVVFDVGANAGALSVMMSRLVGPRGVVCAFEASRRIIDKTQYNVAVNGCGNVQIFHNAISDKSGDRLEIFAGSHLNDSILSSNGTSTGTFVDTIALERRMFI